MGIKKRCHLSRCEVLYQGFNQPLQLIYGGVTPLYGKGIKNALRLGLMALVKNFAL